MKLNMRAGELGVIVKSDYGNEGKIVRVLRIAGRNDVCMNGRGMNPDSGAWWFIDGIIKVGIMSGGTHMTNVATDECLRPLRDSDGEDETFTWAGKPEEVKA